MRVHQTIAAVVILGGALSGQAAAQRSTSFGLLGGAAFSRLSGADATTGEFDFTKSKLGLTAGGFVSLGLGPNFAIQPEVFFVQKGAKAKPTGGTVKFRLGYVEVPVLAKLIIPAKGSGIQLSPHFYGGPAIAFKTSCSISGSDGSTTVTGKCDANNVRIKSTDLSVLFGAGVDIGRFMIEVRYDLGLSKIDDSGEDLDAKNRTLYVLGGWKIRTP